MSIGGIKIIVYGLLIVIGLTTFYFVKFLPKTYADCESLGDYTVEADGSKYCNYLGIRYDYHNYLSLVGKSQQ